MALHRCSPSVHLFLIVVVLDLVQDCGMEWVRLEQSLGWGPRLGVVGTGIGVAALLPEIWVAPMEVF